MRMHILRSQTVFIRRHSSWLPGFMGLTYSLERYSCVSVYFVPIETILNPTITSGLKLRLGTGILSMWSGCSCSSVFIGGAGVEAVLVDLHGRTQIFIDITGSVRAQWQMPALRARATVLRLFNRI